MSRVLDDELFLVGAGLRHVDRDRLALAPDGFLKRYGLESSMIFVSVISLRLGSDASRLVCLPVDMGMARPTPNWNEPHSIQIDVARRGDVALDLVLLANLNVNGHLLQSPLVAVSGWVWLMRLRADPGQSGFHRTRDSAEPKARTP